jgi:hypothetical protein
MERTLHPKCLERGVDTNQDKKTEIKPRIVKKLMEKITPNVLPSCHHSTSNLAITRLTTSSFTRCINYSQLTQSYFQYPHPPAQVSIGCRALTCVRVMIVGGDDISPACALIVEIQ